MSNQVCRAKDPSTCKYHGSLAYHTEQYNAASEAYTNALRLSLTNPTPQNKYAVYGVQDKYYEAQARVDAHDEKLEELQTRLKELDWPKDYDEESEKRDIERRVRAAEEARKRRVRPEAPTEMEGVHTAPVRNLPRGAVLLNTGETVLGVSRGSYGRKMNVVLRKKNGETVSREWNASTEIAYTLEEA